MAYYILKSLHDNKKYVCITKHSEEKLLDIFYKGRKPWGGKHTTIDRKYVYTPRAGVGWGIIEWMKYLPRGVKHGYKTYEDWQREV